MSMCRERKSRYPTRTVYGAMFMVPLMPVSGETDYLWTKCLFGEEEEDDCFTACEVNKYKAYGCENGNKIHIWY